MATELKKYRAKVEDVFSGDDLTLMVDLEVDGLHVKRRCRLHGVDTPNAMGESLDTEAGKIKMYVRNMLRHKIVNVTLVSQVRSSWIVIIELHKDGDTFNVNDDLIGQGYKFDREKATP